MTDIILSGCIRRGPPTPQELLYSTITILMKIGKILFLSAAWDKNFKIKFEETLVRTLA